ncbi:MAG: hypothetical protein V4507_15155 [Verrucomicrobiota bacterium]
MKLDPLNGAFSDPFNKSSVDRPSDATEGRLSVQQLQKIIRIFTVVFILSMVLLVSYYISQQVPTFPELLAKKEIVYLPIKPTEYRSTDPIPEEEVQTKPLEAERVYRSKLYQMGNMKYRAAIIYWNKDDIPSGTTYKETSPYSALNELKNNDRYDGAVFLKGGTDQEYFEKSAFEDLMAKMKSKKSGVIRIKD